MGSPGGRGRAAAGAGERRPVGNRRGGGGGAEGAGERGGAAPLHSTKGGANPLLCSLAGSPPVSWLASLLAGWLCLCVLCPLDEVRFASRVGTKALAKVPPHHGDAHECTTPAEFYRIEKRRSKEKRGFSLVYPAKWRITKYNFFC